MLAGAWCLTGGPLETSVYPLTQGTQLVGFEAQEEMCGVGRKSQTLMHLSGF